MNEEQAREVFETTQKHAAAEHLEMSLSGGVEASTRFANNAITQNVARTNVQLQIRAAFGQQVGAVRLNRFDEESLRDAVQRAEEIARQSTPDPEYLPPPGPQTYAAVQAWDDAIAAATPGDRAETIRRGIARAEAEGLNSAGSYATDTHFQALANSNGLFAYHRSTAARYVCTAMTPDSSGWAVSANWSAAGVDAESAACRAVNKALAARDPQTVAPGPCTVILEPAAVADMLAFLAWTMDAKAADEGHSVFTGKQGVRIAPETITVESRPDHPECPATPFQGDGMPSQATRWVDRGVVANLSRGRYWAQHTGQPYTGSPSNLLLQGGDSSVEQMIASTEEGILVTRFWYIRFVDPMRLLLTGMTRDGLFRVRDGRVVGGLKNMRFNQSVLEMLANTAALGRPVPVGGYAAACVPPMLVREFNFSSGTEF